MRAALSAAALALCAGSADALTLECANRTDQNVAIAVSYLDLDNKTWIVEGWYNLQGNTTANIELDSKNNIFYIFGEFANGIRVDGQEGPGGLKLPIFDRTFRYVYGPQVQGASESVVFIRGQAENNHAQITLGPFKQ